MESGDTKGLSPRSLALGTLLCLFISISTPYGVLWIQGSEMAENFATPAAILLFLILVLVNGVLKTIGRSHGIEPAELVTIYIMMSVACAIPTMGLTANLLPIMTGSSYYATPENEWAELIQPYIARWIPHDPDVVKYFYEGLPRGMAVPWRGWIGPLLIWLPFLVAVYAVMISMMLILGKQWVERERLLFPLAQLPLEMMKEDEGGSRLNPFFRSKLMWAGAAIPFAMGSWNALHSYYPFIHPIEVGWFLPILRQTTYLEFKIVFPVIGFAYLLNLNVAFSLWFFCIMGNVQTGIMRIIGWSIGPREPYCASSPSVSYQAMGAMIVLVLYGIWVARHHLRDVLRSAWRARPSIDEPDDAAVYRAAVCGIVGGSLIVILWLEMIGLRWYYTLIFLFAAFVLFTGLTRIIAEAGLACAKAPLIPQSFLIYGVGSTALGSVGLVALASTFAWSADLKTFVMASMANGLKLANTTGMKKRSVFLAAMVAILVSLVGSIWMTLKLGYKHGGINLQAWYFGGCPRVPFDYVTNIILNPVAVDIRRWSFAGGGAALMVFLMFMNHRFLWWPFHPIGFPIGNTLPLIHTWFSIFLAWLLKSAILKYGGPKLYSRLRPFFLGLIIGHVSVAAMWLVIDHFSGIRGNVVPFQ